VAGQAAKICNNMILGISMIAVSEAFVLAKRLGLDAQKLFDVSVHRVRTVLVSDELLSRAGPGADLAGQP
jgi:3-hydroxyisobutyrate dehydrogenase-like beta-hydroxyacid dehydrogenase